MADQTLANSLSCCRSLRRPPRASSGRKVTAQEHNEFLRSSMAFLSAPAGSRVLPRCSAFDWALLDGLEPVSQLLRVGNVPWRCVFETVAFGIAEGKIQVGAEFLVPCSQKGNALPSFRFHEPTEQQFRGGKLPRLAVGKELAQLGKFRCLGRVASVGQSPFEPQLGILPAADHLDNRPGVRVQRLHPAPMEHRHVLPSIPVQRLLGRSHLSGCKSEENRHDKRSREHGETP